MNLKEIAKKHEAFLGSDFQVYFTPGRVNLIGEHIDYEGGRVFPIAINLGTYAFVSKREDREFHFLSANFLEFGEKIIKYQNQQASKKYEKFSKFMLDENFNRMYTSSSKLNLDLNFEVKDNWVNYPKGVIKYFIEAGVNMDSGLNILIFGNLPKSSGLSSSASLEVLIGTVLKHQYSISVDHKEIALISQFVENRYMNMNCGIMDQFAVAMGKEDKAIYLDTSTLNYDYVPLNTGDYVFVISNTNKPRNLVESKYNERVEECNIAKMNLNKKSLKVDLLCDLSSSDFLAYKDAFESPTIANRVEHIIKENERTKEAVHAFRNSDMKLFGKLMNESHDSLRDLYEVSCKELNTLVDSFRRYGAIGARMTGAGFGGCTISLVKTSQLDDIIKKVSVDYLDAIGFEATFYPVKASDGTKKLKGADLL